MTWHNGPLPGHTTGRKGAVFLEYFNAFWVGGLICALGQVLIDKTKLTPARIMVGFVTAGVALGALGLYGPLADFAACGATVALTGFGWA